MHVHQPPPDKHTMALHIRVSPLRLDRLAAARRRQSVAARSHRSLVDRGRYGPTAGRCRQQLHLFTLLNERLLFLIAS